MADADALLISNLNVAALGGGNAHPDLGSIRDAAVATLKIWKS
jgi:hypothetical protein